MSDDFELVSSTGSAVLDEPSPQLPQEAVALEKEAGASRVVAAEDAGPPPVPEGLVRPATDDFDADEIRGRTKLTRKDFDRQLSALKPEIFAWLRRIEQRKLKLVVLFDGRDAGRKRGVVSRIAEAAADPRTCRVARFTAPTQRERTQWFFQPYVAALPAAGEAVLFDGSWYSRAAAERLMGFRSDAEYGDLLGQCAEFEQILGRAGVTVIKYWLSIHDDDPIEQFDAAVNALSKACGLSTKSFDSRARLEDHGRLRDAILAASGGPSPWYAIESDDRRSLRLTCIRHLLGLVPRTDMDPVAVVPNVDEVPEDVAYE